MDGARWCVAELMTHVDKGRAQGKVPQRQTGEDASEQNKKQYIGSSFR